MKSSATCSWCYAINPTTERYCQQCGHEAHTPRSCCRCLHCSRMVLRTSDDTGDTQITTVADAVDAVLDELLRRRLTRGQ